MTYRTIFGLTFKVFSPSLWELCAFDDGSPVAFVAVAYTAKAWYIDVLMKSGATRQRGPFRSREDAIALLAGRQEQSA